MPGLREPIVDGRTLRARADHGASAVPAVLAALDGAGIAVASVTVARPSLDDVYLRHTGHIYAQTEKEDITVTAAVSQTCARSPAATLRALLRQPWFVGFWIVQPIIWLLLFGALFKSVVSIPGFGGSANTWTTSCPAC